MRDQVKWNRLGVILGVAAFVGLLTFTAGTPAALMAPQAAAQAPPSDASTLPPAATPVASHPSPRAVLDRYCVTCHSDRLKTGGLTLQQLDADNVGANTDTWEKVLQKLQTGAMPPVGRPRPDATAAAELSAWLERSLDEAGAAKPNPGVLAIHRLNRTEYTNAVRDILDLAIDGSALLPADSSGYGFDNVAEALTLSPSLLDRYMVAAQTISRLAVGDPTIKPVIDRYKPLELYRQEDRADEDLPFGTRGGIAATHNFPVDGRYTIGVRLQRTLDSVIRGVNEKNELEIYLDGALVKSFEVYCPPSQRGGTSQNNGTLEECAQSADAALNVSLPVTAGPHLVGAAFVKRSAMKEGLGLDRVPIVTFTYSYGRNTQVSVEAVEIGGPVEVAGPGESPSRRSIFVCHPRSDADEACATRIVSTLARHAYRRPVGDEDVRPLVEFFRAGAKERGFDGGVQLALRAILVNPNFLFRIEREPKEQGTQELFRIRDLDLASRLSFFLWSSIPDDQLLDLAERNQLHQPVVLHQQIKRMLADDRARALVDNFGGQWLYLRNVSAATPDAGEFPDFDDNLREAFHEETALFFASQLREDRPLIEMLTAKYTFLNERLAEFYGLPNVRGSHFRRVPLPEEGPRAGLLGQGSLLLATSYGNRTSPVLRGKWLLENVLGAPPPPPPPNVPALEEEHGASVPRTMRSRMEQHRKNPACATCHSHIDPMGFALENFDGVGQWRDVEGGKPVDASGVLVNGEKFNGPRELRAVLERHQGEFALTVTKKLFTYALGRGVQSSDMPTIRKILQQAQAQDYQWSTLIDGIVNSQPFLMGRRSQS